MKKKIILAIITLWSMVYGLSSMADGIEFIHDKKFQEILDMAKAQNKLVFMDCYTSWCGPCKRLSSMVFPDSAVGMFYNSTFINSKFDMEKDEGVDIAGKYGVRAYPTLLWIDGEGNVKHKVVGGLDPEGLIAQGKKAIDPTPGILAGMKKQYADGNRDVSFLSDFLNTLNASGESYDDIFKEYLSKLSPENGAEKKHIQTIFNLTNDIKSPGLDFVVKNKNACINIVGAEAYNKKINQIASKAASAAPKADDKGMFEAAINLVKNNKAPDHAEKTLKFSLDYYLAMGDWANYDKFASQYIKKYASKDAALMNDVAWNYFINILNADKLKKATRWAFDALNMDNKYTYNLTYAYLLYKQNQYKEAEKACDYAIIRANAENVQPTSATALKDAIKKSLEK